MCLAVGSGVVGRDGPVATVSVDSRAASAFASVTPPDVVLFTFPDRLANEPPPPLLWAPARIRSTEGLVTDARRPGDISIVTWTELGTVYWLSSDRRNAAQLVDIANNLR